ncbi:MAG: sortase [Ruminococcus sp.]|nr:sortase [Ruminococcus sp.]
MKSKIKKFLIFLGSVMIIAAAVLCAYNIHEGKKAGIAAEAAVTAIKSNLPVKSEKEEQKEIVPSEDDLYASYEQDEQQESISEIIIDGISYYGYLTIPALGLELPIRTELSYPALKESPCRFSGSVQNNDLIIAAHNFPDHFGRISKLGTGDQIILTDATGETYIYSVIYTEIIAGTDPPQMFNGQSEEWDLSLFTCTIGGQNRITVRASIIEK